MTFASNLTNLLPKDGEVFLIDAFYTTQNADAIHAQLLAETAWKQESVMIFGKKVLQPRLTAWYSEINQSYRYSGLSLSPSPYTALLRELNHDLNQQFDLSFNSALLNWYRNGSDSMGWHRDNEKILGKQPIIASLSFGIARQFRLQHYYEKHLKLSLTLSPGSLLIMCGDTQEYWSHCLPKSNKVLTSRVNITFRHLK